ncbi:hypothetical protein P3S68_011377 [Capsicum galapagoense]
MVVGSDPKDCETETVLVEPADLVSASTDYLSRKKTEIMARKQNKMEKEELKIKDRARKRDKQHKGQKRFDLIVEQLDDQFPPFQGKIKILPVQRICVQRIRLLHLLRKINIGSFTQKMK